MESSKRYKAMEDSGRGMVSESLGTYNTACEQIVLTIPKEMDADIIRDKVDVFYTQLLDEIAEEQKFQTYRRNWETEIRFVSDPYKIISNQYFQSIIGMGKKAIPYIIKDIKREPSFLFVALEQICGQRIAKVEKQGVWNCINVSESCRRWIERLEA